MSYEITITPAAETGTGTCTAGDWEEQAAGHAAVAEMQWHAVQHTIATGHQVDQQIHASRTVRPLSGIDY